LQCLVIAGLADYARPADKLSVGQSTALAATGLFHLLCFTRIILTDLSIKYLSFLFCLSGMLFLFLDGISTSPPTDNTWATLTYSARGYDSAVCCS